MVDVPYFEELTAKNVFQEIRHHPVILQYLPNLDSLKRPLSR